MRLLVVCVGKLKDPHLRALVDDYVGRLGHYAPTEVLEVKDDEAGFRHIPEKYLVCALDEHGVEWNTASLRQFVEREMVSGRPGVAFLIGGADGLSEAVLRRADLRLSLSRLTLPHRLARLVLCEQLYRVMTMIRGEPYHRE